MAEQQPTGHDKAVQLVARVLMQPRMFTNMSGDKQRGDAMAVLAALRAALAAGDADVAEALGGRIETIPEGYWFEGSTPVRRFATPWTEATR